MKRTKGGPGAFIFVGAILALIGAFFLVNAIPNYQKVAHAQPISLDKVMGLAPGTVVKCKVKTSPDSVMTTQGGDKVAYEHVKIEHRVGTGKNKHRDVEQEAFAPEKVTVSDNSSTLDIPSAQIDDNFLDKMGPFDQNASGFAKANAMLVPQFADYGKNIRQDRELVVATLPANADLTFMARRSDEIPGIPLAGVSDGFIKTKIILTHNSPDEVAQQLQFAVIGLSVFTGIGLLLLVFGGLQFFRRII